MGKKPCGLAALGIKIGGKKNQRRRHKAFQQTLFVVVLLEKGSLNKRFAPMAGVDGRIKEIWACLPDIYVPTIYLHYL
jgi:hypothetical protein